MHDSFLRFMFHLQISVFAFYLSLSFAFSHPQGLLVLSAFKTCPVPQASVKGFSPPKRRSSTTKTEKVGEIG